MKGFSLLELVLVLVVLGILAVASIPRFTGGTPYQTRAYFDELAAAVRYGQKTAVAGGCRVQVQLSGGAYALYQDEDCRGGSFSQPLQNPGTGENFARSAPGGVSLSGSDFVFTSLGRLEGESDVEVSVSGAGQTRSFRVVAETGYVVKD